MTKKLFLSFHSADDRLLAVVCFRCIEYSLLRCQIHDRPASEKEHKGKRWGGKTTPIRAPFSVESTMRNKFEERNLCSTRDKTKFGNSFGLEDSGLTLPRSNWEIT